MQDVVTQGLIRSAVGTLEEKAKAQLKKEELRKSTMSKRHKQGLKCIDFAKINEEVIKRS